MENFVSKRAFILILLDWMTLINSLNLNQSPPTIHFCNNNGHNWTFWSPPDHLRAPHSAPVNNQLEKYYGGNLYTFKLKHVSSLDQLLQKSWGNQSNEGGPNIMTRVTLTHFDLDDILAEDLENEPSKNVENAGDDPSIIIEETFEKDTFFTPAGYLKIQNGVDNDDNSSSYENSSTTFFSPTNYCLKSKNGSSIIETKWPPPSARFIPKCCPPGFVFAVNLTSSQATTAFIGCKESFVEWRPALFERLGDDQPIKNPSMSFDFRVRRDWRDHCKTFWRYTIPRRLPPLPTSTTNSSAYRRKQLRILKTGQIYSRISGNHPWKLERKPKYWSQGLCIDATWDVHRSPKTYEPSEDDLILINCKPHFDKTGIRRLYFFIILSAAFFCLLIIIVYGSIWTQLTTHGWTVTFFALSMFIWYLTYASGLAVNYRGGLPLAETPQCIALGILVHFFHLATFCWMTVMNFDLWSSITSKTIRPTTGPYRKKRFCAYACFAYGVPTIVVSIGVTLEAEFDRFDDRLIRPQYGQWRCVVDDTGFLQYVLSVDLIMICLNMLLAISTGRHMWAFKRRAKRVHGAKSELDLYRRLFVVCGFSWILDIVMYSVDPEQLTWFHIMVNLGNILQAVAFAWIFLSKKDIRDKFASRLNCRDNNKRPVPTLFLERSSRST